MTIICLALRLLGPLGERSLCLVLLALQAATCVAVFWVRFVLFKENPMPIIT
jgi:hypothetical protein